MSTIKVDTVRPVTSDASLTLQGDNGGTGVSGITIDGSGNAAFAGDIELNSTTFATESAGTITVSNVDSTTNRTNLGIDKTFIQMDVFTASGTYTKPTGTTDIIVWMVGAGGGGGGSLASTNGNGGGGAGGGGCMMQISDSSSTFSGSSTVTVTLGSGGAGGAGNTAGSAGGSSSFGSFATLTGGGGGHRRDGGAGGGIPGSCTFGTGADAPDAAVSIVGMPGHNGNLGGSAFGSPGGSTFLGGGAHGLGYAGNAGVAASGYGAGGSSGANSSGVATSYAGGNGNSGICIVWSYKS